MKTFRLILILLILVCSFPTGSYGSDHDGSKKGAVISSPHFKTVVMRKLLNGGGVQVMDYHDPGPNPSHDPGKGKGGH